MKPLLRWICAILLIPCAAQAGSQINVTLEAYAEHSSRVGPRNTDLKTFTLPKGKSPWRVHSCNPYETTRNGGEFTNCQNKQSSG